MFFFCCAGGVSAESLMSLSGLVLNAGELADSLQAGFDTREALVYKFVELEDLITTRKRARHASFVFEVFVPT